MLHSTSRRELPWVWSACTPGCSRNMSASASVSAMITTNTPPASQKTSTYTSCTCWAFWDAGSKVVIESLPRNAASSNHFQSRSDTPAVMSSDTTMAIARPGPDLPTGRPSVSRRADMLTVRDGSASLK